MPQVAPYSGDMLPSVARSASGRWSRPSPKYSTNLPTTPLRRSIWVTVSTRSVAVAPSGRAPVSLKPITSGMTIEIGWPSMAASASMPPTPQPRMPRPLIMVVWLSSPTTVSGNATWRLPSAAVHTTWPRYSRLTWWQIPVPGGTTWKLSNAVAPQRRNA